MKSAICTLVIGERFEKLFGEFSARSWQDYCRAHGYELFVFRKPFADLPGKSYAWQKLFLLDQPELRSFDKIVWLDADIIIKAGAPPIDAPAGLIGYVPEPPITGNVATWYESFGLPPAPDIVQTGVLCLELAHAAVLHRAIQYPETKLYEMPALSWHISQSGFGYLLDRRFNAVPAILMLNRAPKWTVENKPIKELLWHLHYPLFRRAIEDVCANNWFIHAAGAKRDLKKASRCLARIEKDDVPSRIQ